MAVGPGGIIFNNAITIATEQGKLLNPLITDILNETDLQENYIDVVQKMRFYDTRALSETQRFSSMGGSRQLDPITEGGTKPELEITKNPDKGFAINEYGNKITTSYLMTQWIMHSRDLNGADSSILQEWGRLRSDSRRLIQGATMRMNIDQIRLLSKGFSITATNGPGSATPKGQPLFSPTQPVKDFSTTFSNVLSTPNQVLSESSLQDAIDKQKRMLGENGFRVKQPKRAYQLWVSKILSVDARRILNTDGNNSGIYSGVGANANQMNPYNFKGNMVDIVEIPLLGEVDSNGVPIGTDTMWFLVNPDGLDETRGFRNVSLYDPIVNAYKTFDTDNYVIDVRTGFAVDHYGAEHCIVGSQGTV